LPAAFRLLPIITGDAKLPLRWLRQLPLCGLAAREHLALQAVPVQQVLQKPAIFFWMNEV